MESVSFFFKTLIISFIAVLVMQIEISGGTIEDHVLGMIRTSSISEPVHRVADGATKVIRNGWNTVSRWINKNRPAVGERAASLFNTERSEGYRRSQEKSQESETDSN